MLWLLTCVALVVLTEACDPAVDGCVWLELTPSNHTEAQIKCEAKNGTLALLTESAVLTAASLKLFGNSKPAVGYWIGLTDNDLEGSFLWLDGWPVTWTAWKATEPDGGSAENCVAWEDGWKTENCSTKLPAVCQQHVDTPVEDMCYHDPDGIYSHWVKSLPKCLAIKGVNIQIKNEIVENFIKSLRPKDDTWMGLTNKPWHWLGAVTQPRWTNWDSSCAYDSQLYGLRQEDGRWCTNKGLWVSRTLCQLHRQHGLEQFGNTCTSPITSIPNGVVTGNGDGTVTVTCNAGYWLWESGVTVNTFSCVCWPWCKCQYRDGQNRLIPDQCIEFPCQTPRRNGVCYWYNSTSVTWHEAQKTCEVDGGMLVSMDGADARPFLLTNIFQPLGNYWLKYEFWIGANDIEVEGVIRWADTHPITWCHWTTFVSGTRSKNVVRLELKSYQAWALSEDTRKERFVCQTRKDFTCAVQDLCNGAQHPGYNMDNFCYLYNSTQVTWENAEQSCEDKGGSLVMITHPEVERELAKLNLGDAWIGLLASTGYYVPGLGVTRWLDGYVPSWSNWHSNYPTSLITSVFRAKDGFWKEKWSSYLAGSICQINKNQLTNVHTGCDPAVVSNAQTATSGKAMTLTCSPGFHLPSTTDTKRDYNCTYYINCTYVYLDKDGNQPPSACEENVCTDPPPNRPGAEIEESSTNHVTYKCINDEDTFSSGEHRETVYCSSQNTWNVDQTGCSPAPDRIENIPLSTSPPTNPAPVDVQPSGSRLQCSLLCQLLPTCKTFVFDGLLCRLFDRLL